jgi:tetratricopeptide (TPR) repeat protein
VSGVARRGPRAGGARPRVDALGVTRVLTSLALLSCGGAPAVAPRPVVVRPVCAPKHDEARARAEALVAEGRLRAAARALEASEASCAPLAALAREERLALHRKLGDVARARELATLVLADGDASPRARALAEAARAEAELGPLEQRPRADLEQGDELFAKGDVRAAVAAYAGAVESEPHDPWALAAWGAALARSGQPALAREAFDRAIVATGADERVVVLAPRTRLSAHREGVLEPAGTRAGVLERTTKSGRAFPDMLVGELATVSETHLVTFGSRPLVLSDRAGRGARTLGEEGVEHAKVSPDGTLLVTASLARAGVYHLGTSRWGAARGLLARGGPGATPASAERTIRFAGPSRVAVGRLMLSLPGLDEVFDLGLDARVHSTAVVELDKRPAKGGDKTFVVIRRLEDGKVVFEPELTEGQDEVLTGSHQTRPIVAWIDGKQSGIADLERGTVTRFRYDWARMIWPTDIRFSHDGRDVCVLDLEWRPSRSTRGKLDVCFVDDAGAIIATLPPTKGMRPGSGLGAVALSPDRALGAYVEVSATDKPAKQVVRVIELATMRELRRIPLEVDDHQAAELRFVGPSLLEVHAELEPEHFDARTGARAERPPQAPRRLVDESSTWPAPGFELSARSSLLTLEERGADTLACVSAKLELLPLAPRCGGKLGDVEVRGGRASLLGKLLELEPPLGGGRGFVSEGERGQRLLMVDKPPAVSVFDATTGKLTFTAAAAGPQGLALLPADPQSVTELVALAEAPASAPLEGLFPQVHCVANGVVLPLEACAERLSLRGVSAPRTSTRVSARRGPELADAARAPSRPPRSILRPLVAPRLPCGREQIPEGGAVDGRRPGRDRRHSALHVLHAVEGARRPVRGRRHRAVAARGGHRHLAHPRQTRLR